MIFRATDMTPRRKFVPYSSFNKTFQIFLYAKEVVRFILMVSLVFRSAKQRYAHILETMCTNEEDAVRGGLPK